VAGGHRAFVGLGSNMGDRQAHILEAVSRLDDLPRTRVVRLSSLVDTAPEEMTEQPRFLNAVAELETALGPEELLGELGAIESDLGRVRTVPKGPRTIDLDLLFCGAQVVQTRSCEVPHPRLHRRAFVLGPLLELAPDLKHPVLERTIRQLWTDLRSD
jgi:2-amino-4-hydroxy-6-hydroxymethyldihydropteridine diphosphokinase